MDAFKETLVEGLGTRNVFAIPLLGGIPVAESVVVSWLIMAALMIATLLLTRRLRVRDPGKVQIGLESAVEFLNGFVKTNIGRHWRPFAPYLGTVALYIALSNLIGIFGLTPPTKDINVTAALALMSMVVIEFSGIHKNGVLHWIKHFAKPVPVVAPIMVLEVVIRPLSLCMRLFGNMLAGFVVLELLKFFVPLIIPIPVSFYFDIFDGLLQAYVFVFLTAIFMTEEME